MRCAITHDASRRDGPKTHNPPSRGAFDEITISCALQVKTTFPDAKKNAAGQGSASSTATAKIGEAVKAINDEEKDKRMLQLKEKARLTLETKSSKKIVAIKAEVKEQKKKD